MLFVDLVLGNDGPDQHRLENTHRAPQQSRASSSMAQKAVSCIQNREISGLKTINSWALHRFTGSRRSWAP